jgi:murein DD-endopeptidase MepM/ murein hydrolase activator NlpD
VKRYIKLLVIGLVVCAIFIAIAIPLFHHKEVKKIIKPVIKPQIEYGINMDSLIVLKNQVKPDQNLSGILQSYNVDYRKIDLLVKMARPVFDVRRLKSGNSYTVLCKNDSIDKAEYFIYEISPVSYVVFDLREKLNVYLGRQEVKTLLTSSSGIITSSLWNAIEDKGLNPYLAVELSDIFAWTIDFFGIQKGDSFRMIYENEVVKEDTIGIGRILAACFNHMGREYYAFYFVQDGEGDYFDDKGNSVRRAFLKAPLRYSRISSRYSNRRLHPILKIYRPHHGIDYSAPSGTPIYSIGDGSVVGVGYDTKGGGRYIRIKHNSTYTSLYMHLSGYAKGIYEGMRVQQGDLIGYVGRSGLATGPHLDFRIFKNGYPVDPLQVESPPSKPVNVNIRKEFDSVAVIIKKQLDEMKILK